MEKRLVITDLDNTLYDWVTFYAQSFSALVHELAVLLQESEDQILDEFKALHQHYGTSEPPFAALELPTVLRRFPGYSLQQRRGELDKALQAFSDARARTLKLYDGVAETLAELDRRDIRIVGHTEAIAANAYFRLNKLGVVQYLRKLYVLHLDLPAHPFPDRLRDLAPPSGLVVPLPPTERKPNPRLLLDICQREGVAPREAIFVGDSLIRDIGMAKEAGVGAAWAKYGTHFDPRYWEVIVRVSHWTPADVARESALRHKFADATPDYSLSGFSDLLTIV